MASNFTHVQHGLLSPTTTTPDMSGEEDECPSKPNARYYLQDTAIVVFEVENELFRVHRYFFTQHSLFFQGLFSLPQGDQDEREWSGTEKNPLHLPDVTKDQLEVLLDFFYKGHTSPRFARSLYDFIDKRAVSKPLRYKRLLKALLDLFSIATRYDFATVRREALSIIQVLRVQAGAQDFAKLWSPIDRLVLATRFDVDEWIMPAYEDLCERADFITLEEAEQIGGRKTAVIALARERYRKEKENVAARPSHPVSATEGPRTNFFYPAASDQPVDLASIIRDIVNAPAT